MSKDDVLSMLVAKKIDVAEAGRLLAKIEPAARGGRRVIKRNSSGGLFVMDGSFKCFSKAKEKHYTGSFNMDADVAAALFADTPYAKQLRDEITAFVAASK